MPVVRFQPEEVNLLESEGRRYFVFSLDGHTFFLVGADCPHRGGPLHLGRWDARACAIRCPWHDRAIPLAALRQRAVPVVWRRDGAVAVLPGQEAGPVLLRHRQVLAREGGARCS
jgi:nitrite reductase (NADH) small subunit